MKISCMKEFIILLDLQNTCNTLLYFLLTEPVCSYRTEIEKRFASAGVSLNSAIEPVPNKTVKRGFTDAEFGLTIGVLRGKEKLTKIAEDLYSKLLLELSKR